MCGRLILQDNTLKNWYKSYESADTSKRNDDIFVSLFNEGTITINNSNEEIHCNSEIYIKNASLLFLNLTFYLLKLNQSCKTIWI